jgi:hypothetical protein
VFVCVCVRGWRLGVCVWDAAVCVCLCGLRLFVCVWVAAVCVCVCLCGSVFGLGGLRPCG